MTANTVETVDTATGEIGTDLVPTSGADIQAMISSLRNGASNVMTTLATESFEDRIKLLGAVTDAQAIADNLGKTIQLQDVVIQGITINDQEKGTKEDTVRVILIDADGTAYAALSPALVRSLETIFGVMGQPETWPAPLPVKVEEKGQKPRKFFTISPAN